MSAESGESFQSTAELLREVAAAVEALGDARAGTALREEAARGGDGAAVAVVAGEKKRGKSSLINALLSRPGFLPVDVDIATGVHIAVGHAEEPEALVFGASDDGPLPIALEQIAEYGALDPVTAEMEHPEVTHLEIGIPDPLLAGGMVLVDTPGVGGLVGGHAALTLAALAGADALVFVVSGASELTASECAFLGQAADRVATVLFVLTQTDKYPGWRQVLQRSQDLVREHAPRFVDAPWFPVSSRLRFDAVRARASGTGEVDAAAAVTASAVTASAVADERDAASGVPQLVDALRTRVAGATVALRRHNARFLAVRVLAAHIAGLERLRRSLVNDPALLAAVERGRDRLAELLRADAQWRTRLAEEFKLLDRELNRSYQRMVADFQASADRRLAEATPADAPEVARELEAGIRAVCIELENASWHGAARIAENIARDFADGDLTAFALAEPGASRLSPLPGLETTEAQETRGLVGLVERFAPGMGIGSLAMHAVGGVAAVAISPLVVIAAGGAVGNMLFQQRRRREAELRTRGDLHRYLQSLLRQTHAELPATLQDGLEAMLRTVERNVAARLDDQRGELERELAAHLANLKATEEELAPRREQTAAALTRLRALAERAAA